MSCQRCNSLRLVQFQAKCDDRSATNIGEAEHHGYVPRDLNIGGGDYVHFTLCLDCGQHRGNFPLPLTELETPRDEDE